MKKLLLLLFLTITIMMYACEHKDKNPMNSLEFSELAYLMRDMHEYSKQLRENILHDSISELPRFSDDWDKLKTAEATDPSVKSPLYNAYSDHYIMTMNHLHDQKLNRISNFNFMVNACISCHEQYCQGPIKTIRKLTIEDLPSKKIVSQF